MDGIKSRSHLWRQAQVAAPSSNGIEALSDAGAPDHGVEFVTGWSVKLGAYSQITFRSQLKSGFS